LRTSAETFPEFQDAIRAKIEMPNADIRLHVKVNENFFILDDMRDLEDGMRIKVSIPSQTTITSKFFQSFFFFFFFFVKNCHSINQIII